MSEVRVCTCGRFSDDTGLRATLVFHNPPREPWTHHFDTLPCHPEDCDDATCPEYGVVSWANKTSGRVEP